MSSCPHRRRSFSFADRRSSDPQKLARELTFARREFSFSCRVFPPSYPISRVALCSFHSELHGFFSSPFLLNSHNWEITVLHTDQDCFTGLAGSPIEFKGVNVNLHSQTDKVSLIRTGELSAPSEKNFNQTRQYRCSRENRENKFS